MKLSFASGFPCGLVDEQGLGTLLLQISPASYLNVAVPGSLAGSKQPLDLALRPLDPAR
jgi:hypothetical protein